MSKQSSIIKREGMKFIQPPCCSNIVSMVLFEDKVIVATEKSIYILTDDNKFKAIAFEASRHE